MYDLKNNNKINIKRNDLYLDYLKKQKAQTLKYIEPPKQQVPWWASLLINIGFGVLSTGIEILASCFLGPVAGMVIGTGLDIGFNFLGDYLSGNDPFSPENLIFNLVLPAVQIPGKIKTVKKLNINKINRLGTIADDKNLQQMSKKLTDMNLSGETIVNKNDRVYKKILKEIDLIDLNANISANQSFAFNKQQKRFRKYIYNANKGARTLYKAINMLDPTYALNSLISYATKPVKNIWNKSITKFFKKIETKFFRKFKERNKYRLLPLKHTQAPWIKGIRLLPAGNSINFYHVVIVFTPQLTNKKAPVYLYNKPYSSIKRFLDSHSAGAYYINNISWGWEIGKFIRNNIDALKKTPRLINLMSYKIQAFYTGVKLIKTLGDLFNKLNHIDETLEKWKDPNNYLIGLQKGAIDGVKGTSFVKQVTRTIETKRSKYLIKYAHRKGFKFTNKYIKKAKPIQWSREQYWREKNKRK